MSDATIRPTAVHPKVRPPLAVAVAVPGSALAGALALALASRSVSAPGSTVLLVYSGLIALCAFVYFARPRLTAAALAILGTSGCVASAFALLMGGTVPWLLVAFWGSSAALLAGLLDYIGRGGPDRLSSVTVTAIVSLLLLSAIGLGEYVRMTWSSAERAMLESVLKAPSKTQSPQFEAAPTDLEQAPGGKWAAYWTVATNDPLEAWDGMREAVEGDGWTVFAEERGRELRARKDDFDLTVIAEEAVPAPFAKGGAPSSGFRGYVSMAAYVSGGTLPQP